MALRKPSLTTAVVLLLAVLATCLLTTCTEASVISSRGNKKAVARKALPSNEASYISEEEADGARSSSGGEEGSASAVPTTTQAPSVSATQAPEASTAATESPVLSAATSTPAPDCYAADGMVNVAPHGSSILIKDLRQGDLVYDGKEYTKVIVNVDMKKGSKTMMYIDGKAIATRNHAVASIVDESQCEVKSHDSVYLLFTESRYVQVHGVRVSNYISSYPVWIQEMGIKMVQYSSLVRELVKTYRSTDLWHHALVQFALVLRSGALKSVL